MVNSFGNISPGQFRNMTLQGNGSLERKLEHLKKNGDEAAIRKFSQDFEALFVQRLLKEMRKSVPKGGLMEKSLSMEWFEEMFDEAVAKEISAGESIGMAQIIYEQLTRSPGVGRPSGAAPLQANRKASADNPENLKNESSQNPLRKPEKKGGADE
ncbi:MAG: rod-binding protein [bacterium]